MEDTGKKEAVVRVEGFLYEFYSRIADLAGKTTEQVMADALTKFAAEAAGATQKLRLVP